jgi:hypothetical protein
VSPTHSSGVVYPLFRQESWTLNLAADFPLHLATHSSGTVYPLFRYRTWNFTVDFPHGISRSSLPTLQIRSTHPSGGIRRLILTVNVPNGLKAPLVFGTHSSGESYPLFRCGLPTLQARILDFEFGCGFPARPRYQCFSLSSSTLNSATDFPQTLSFLSSLIPTLQAKVLRFEFSIR